MWRTRRVKRVKRAKRTKSEEYTKSFCTRETFNNKRHFDYQLGGLESQERCLRKPSCLLTISVSVAPLLVPSGTNSSRCKSGWLSPSLHTPADFRTSPYRERRNGESVIA